jgi:ribosomal protein S18 acetylase RimI-like enzyme
MMSDPRIETLTAAFYDDPLIEFLLPVEESRAKWLSVGMEFVLGLSSQQLHTGTEDDECSAVIGAVPPGHYPLPLLKSYFVISKLVFKSLLSGMPLRLMSRWLRIFATIERMHPSESHWYVLVLGVHPNHQGKGLGGKLLNQVLQKADADGVAVYLESSNPKNLDFYRKHGFEVISEIIPIDGCPPVRGLLRMQAVGPTCDSR